MKKLVLFLFVLFLLYPSCSRSENIISSFYMYPNPFIKNAQKEATFGISLTSLFVGNVKIVVKDSNYVSVWEQSKSITVASSFVSFKWSCRNYNGLSLMPGIYYAELSLTGSYSSESNIEILVR